MDFRDLNHDELEILLSSGREIPKDNVETLKKLMLSDPAISEFDFSTINDNAVFQVPYQSSEPVVEDQTLVKSYTQSLKCDVCSYESATISEAKSVVLYL